MHEDHVRDFYERLVVQQQAAYAAFATTYEQQHPRPTRRAEAGDGWLIPAGLLILIIASIIVSGSRTITEFGGGMVGIAAFVMLEGGIIAIAYFRKRRTPAIDLAHSQRLARVGLYLSFMVALAANIHAVLKNAGVQIAADLNTIILLSVGLSAPTLALIAGDLMAIEVVSYTNRTRNADEKHQQAVNDWLDGLNRAWSANRSRWGASVQVDSLPDGQADARPALSAPVPDSGRTADGQRTSAETAMRELFMQNPDARTWSVRRLASQLQIGKTTASETRKRIINEV